MENKNSNNIEDINEDEYIKEKKKFISLFFKLLFTVGLISLIIYDCSDRERKKIELVKNFRMNSELICSNKIVSIKNGWDFNVKNERFYKGDDTFSIKICRERK